MQITLRASSGKNATDSAWKKDEFNTESENINYWYFR